MSAASTEGVTSVKGASSSGYEIANKKHGRGDSGSIFPDLHHKMSKKIAQLTRVIYHLNTINENHESVIAGVRYDYETEIRSIVQDSLSRIRSLEVSIDAKKSAVINQSIYL
jgi:hypothetical protein